MEIKKFEDDSGDNMIENKEVNPDRNKKYSSDDLHRALEDVLKECQFTK
jgi:hypothetical protein